MQNLVNGRLCEKYRETYHVTRQDTLAKKKAAAALQVMAASTEKAKLLTDRKDHEILQRSMEETAHSRLNDPHFLTSFDDATNRQQVKPHAARLAVCMEGQGRERLCKKSVLQTVDEAATPHYNFNQECSG